MSAIERELEELRHTQQIKEWSVSLGYGSAEYTVEVSSSNISHLKTLAKRLNQKYGAHNFTKYDDRGVVAVKFVVNL